jgi:hypothetical protein
MSDIDNLPVGSLQKTMDIEVEDEVVGFVGVNIDKKEDDTLQLTQKGLIDQIIVALNVDDMPDRRTPAEVRCLGKDIIDGAPCQGTFSYPSVIGLSYPSVIGQLQHMQGPSRPDLTTAASQCARHARDRTKRH